MPDFTPSLVLLFDDVVFAISTLKPDIVGDSKLLYTTSFFFKLFGEWVQVHESAKAKHHVDSLSKYSGDPLSFPNPILYGQIQEPVIGGIGLAKRLPFPL